MAGKEMVPVGMGRPEWLPEGWSVEHRRRRLSNMVDTYYICPFSSRKLRSRLEVMRFLNAEILDRPASKSAPLDGGYKPLAQLDHNPGDLPDGWIVETRLRRNCSRTDSYYIDPLSGYKFRSKKDVFRYLDNQEVSRIACRQRTIHTPDAYYLKEESKKIHTPDAYSLKEESLPLIEFIKSRVKRTVTRRCLFPREGSISNASTEINIVDAPEKQVSSFTGDTPAPLAVRSEPGCLTPAIVEHLEQRIKKFQIECQVKSAVHESGIQQKLETKMPPEPGKEILSRGTLETPKKQKRKRKAEVGNVAPSRNSKRQARVTVDPDSDFKTGKMSRREKTRKIELESQQDVPITDELQERLEKLKLFVEQATQEKREDQKDESEADELREKLSRLDLFAEQDSKKQPVDPIATPPFGDSWPDPCIEFAFRTLTSDILVLEDIATIQDYLNYQLVSTQRSN